MINNDKPIFNVCANCKYWDCYRWRGDNVDDLLSEFGDCHRYPVNVPLADYITEDGHVVPAMILNDTPLMGHTQTFGSDWCGEFEEDVNIMFPEGAYMP